MKEGVGYVIGQVLKVAEPFILTFVVVFIGLSLLAASCYVGTQAYYWWFNQSDGLKLLTGIIAVAATAAAAVTVMVATDKSEKPKREADNDE